MEITRFGPDDTDAVAAYAETMTASRVVDAPWQPPMSVRRAEARLRYGWDGEVEVAFLGEADGTPVGVATLAVSEYDNLQLAWLGVAVRPEHRRRGHGSVLLDHLLAETRAVGRTLVGIDGWDSDATRGFAARHGFEQKSVGVQRQQHLGELDWDLVTRLHDDARAAASAYELLRWEGRTPDDQLDALAELTEAINDAPTDDLELEDEVYPPERVRAYEDAQIAGGHRLYRVVARHRETGRLGGHTVVAVEEDAPHRGWQHDTAVASDHRGHRLGLLLKSDMNLWLRDAEPALEVVSTFNAETNDHMIGVNEKLGYRIAGRELEFQRAV